MKQLKVCEISVPLRCYKTSAPYSIVEPRHIVAGVIALIKWREVLSERVVLVKSLVYTRHVSTSAKVRAACSKNNANIEEIIVDGGFGFHAKVK